MSWSLRIIAVVLAFTASAAAAQDATTTAITHASSRGVPSSLLVLQGHWVLDELASGLVKPSISGIIPWFTVENQKIQGYDGCNEFYGDLDISGSIITTRRGCPDGVIKLPLDLTDPMPQLKAAKIRGGQLLVPPAAPLAMFTMRKAS